MVVQAPGPILMAAPHADVAPHAYVRMRYTQCCNNCQHVIEYTRLFAKTRLRSTLGNGWVMNMRVLDEPPKYNLPVLLQNAEPEMLPICVHCPADALASAMAQLPAVPPPPTENIKNVVQTGVDALPRPKYTRWQDAHGFWHTEKDTVVQLKPKAEAPKIKTTDDLLSLLNN